MSLPSFSVIIPVYNGGATLGRAIESVLAQSYPAAEVIVVNDGSTDDTDAVITGFRDRVLRLHQANAGVSAARNAGARRAKGEWLAFLDADDWYYRDRLRWHGEWIARDAELDFLTGDYEYRRPDGSLISRSMEVTDAGTRLLKKANGAREVVMGEEEIESFIENHFGDTHTLSVPRRTFVRLGGYRLGQAVCEDVNFLIRLCAVSPRVGVICEPMGVYLIRPDSATRGNRLQSQRLTVDSLLPLRTELASAPQAIRRGYRGRLRNARLNLAYAFLKERRRVEAIGSILGSLTRNERAVGLRDLASIIRGCVQRHGGSRDNTNRRN